MNFQVIKKHEESVKSPPCKITSDYSYDNCIYGAKQRKMVEEFNCTFAFFSNMFYPSSNGNYFDCTVGNITTKSIDLFYDIIKDEGEGNFK